MISRGRIIFVTLLFSICYPLLVNAMHIIGGEVTYTCLGDAGPGQKRYKFTMKVYRDCYGGGADFDDPARMAIYRGTYNDASLFESFGISSPKIKKLIPDTPQCVAMVPNLCVEEAIYEFERILPVVNESYFVVYQRCCRNVSINNIFTPGDIGATFFVELTAKAQEFCNDSPVFNNFPPIIVCKGFPLEFDHSASDSDGDFLVYSFCAPFQGGGPILSPPSALTSCIGAAPTPPCAPPFDPVPFITPLYTPNFPMGGAPPVSINSSTGFITGTPNILGQFVVGVCVEEYRNGILLSTVRREFQFNVTDCSPTVVAKISSDSIAGPKKYVVASCGDFSVTFQNQSVQQQFINKYRWAFNINGNTVVDSTHWNATITFPDTGTYNGTLYLNPGQICGDTAYITVNIFPKVTANFSYTYDTCVAGPVIFTDHSFGDGVVNRWDWDFGVPNGNSDLQNPQYLYPIPGEHNVRLRAYDTNRCYDDTIQQIRWYPVPPIIIIQPNTYLGCLPADIFFNNLSTPIDSTYHIVWDFGDGTGVQDIISPTHKYTQAGTYDVSVQITSPIGCYTEDKFFNLIRVKPSPKAAFDCAPDTLLSNFNNTVHFLDQSIDANRWNWTFGNFGVSTEQNPTFTFPDTGKVKVRLIVTHPEGCRDSAFKMLDIIPMALWHMPNAFTPNGDGVNDEFFGAGFLEGVSDFKMTIWNRWGELIFETTDPTQGWSGQDQKSGAMSPVGVYIYIVSYTEPRGKPIELKGFATLLR